jgi:hypothetical protein
VYKRNNYGQKSAVTASSNSCFLAVFWYVNGDFIGQEDTLRGSSVQQFGDYSQIDADHFFIWDDYKNLNPSAYDKDYDYFPRGRVIFDNRLHKFKVVADRKITDNPSIRSELLSHYGLPITTIFEFDEHYQSY